MDCLIGEFVFEFEPLEGKTLEELLASVKLAPPGFLLPGLIEALGRIGKTLFEFEQILGTNQLELRAKIVGRSSPREAYSLLFPIGRGKVYKGVHTVTAHNPPDLDTAVASFWSFVDAFAAEVSEDGHRWNLPGKVTSQIERLFTRYFGEHIFDVVATKEAAISEGTVSVRDFSNHDEVKITAPIISVVDHHRSNLKTDRPATIHIADVQSCNTLLAELAREIGPRSRDREIVESFCYLHAILDDTDLLSRVTWRDLQAIVHLVNRIKGREVVTMADSRHLLEHPELYSLYHRTIAMREEEIHGHVQASIEGQPHALFADTKVQKGSARVGQTKLFPNNAPLFFDTVDHLRRSWIEMANQIHRENPDLHLHLHMVSTIAGAEEIHKGCGGGWDHFDELWIWVPKIEPALAKLGHYLQGFMRAPEVVNNNLSAQIIGSEHGHLHGLLEDHLDEVHILEAEHETVAVLRFDAGSITSRKNSITPHLP